MQHEMDARADVRHRKAHKKARLATAAHVRRARQRKIRVQAARVVGVNHNPVLQAIQILSDRMDIRFEQQSKCLCLATLLVFNLNPCCYLGLPATLTSNKAISLLQVPRPAITLHVKLKILWKPSRTTLGLFRSSPHSLRRWALLLV